MEQQWEQHICGGFGFHFGHYFVFVFVRTGIAHGRVQQVHGGSAQAQPAHAVRGLFEVRHHARSSEGRPDSGRTGQVRVLSDRLGPSAPAKTQTQNSKTTSGVGNCLKCWLPQINQELFKPLLIFFFRAVGVRKKNNSWFYIKSNSWYSHFILNWTRSDGASKRELYFILFYF